MLNESLSNLLFSTYIGGSNNDACYSVKIDSSFNIVFAGGTSSSNLQQTTGAWQPNYMGGKVDGFVGKLNQTGTVLQRITYVGTSNYDQVFFVEIDRDDNVYLLGQSRGGTFPVINATFSNPNSTQFITKLNPDLSAVLNSTVFGNGNTNNLNISPAAFLVDNCGNIYVCGWGANILLNTMLSGMPVTPDAYQGTSPNGFDFYLMVMNRTFSDLIYGTYLGGNQAREHVDGGTSRFDKNGIVYQSVCGGCGGIPSDFPTTPNAWSDQNLSSNCNNVVFKFDFGITPNAEFTVDQTSGCAAFEVTFDNTSTEDDSYLWDFGDGNLDSTTFNPTVVYTEPGTYEVTLYVTDSICQVTDVAQITIEVLDSLIVDAGAEIELCAPVSITLTGNSFGTSDSFIWSTNNTFNDQLNTSLSDSVLTITPSGSAVYYFQGSNAFCNDYDSVLVTFTSSSLELNGETSICAGDQTTISLSNNNPSINFTYQWAPASSIIGSSSETSVVVSPAVTGYIYITASASNGCLVEDSILINVSNLGNTSVVASSSDYYVVQGTTVTLTGEPGGSGYTVVWTPSNAVTNPTVSQTTAVIEESTLFTYTVSDGFCTKSDTVFVQKIELACEEPFIYIPNAFTPNGDNENDVLFVRGPVVEEMLFRVFNRWGELVFESTSRSVGWDGTFKGRPCDPDVYDYYLEGICVGGEEVLIKGNVTLIR
jgi:gliding motility-associated-like protein